MKSIMLSFIFIFSMTQLRMMVCVSMIIIVAMINKTMIKVSLIALSLTSMKFRSSTSMCNMDFLKVLMMVRVAFEEKYKANKRPNDNVPVPVAKKSSITFLIMV